MGFESWIIGGLVVIFCIPVPAQDVAELLHRQTQELMDAVGAGQDQSGKAQYRTTDMDEDTRGLADRRWSSARMAQILPPFRSRRARWKSTRDVMR
jgi:hypothetical protein